MARINFENGVSVEFQGNPTPQDVEEVARSLEAQGMFTPKKKKGPGFIQSVAQTVANVPLKLGTTVASIGNQAVGLGASMIGNQGLAQQTDRNVAKLNEGTDFGYFGKVAPINSMKDAVGTGLQGASYAIPGAGSAARILAGGAVGAGLQATGDALSKDESIGSALKSGIVAAPFGAAAGVASKALGVGAKTAAKTLGAVTKWTTSQMTGFSPKTVKMLVTQPEKLTPEIMESFDRASVATKVEQAIQQGARGVRELGAEYEPIRKLAREVDVPGDTFSKIMGKYGIQVQPKFGKGGQIVDVDLLRTSESQAISDADADAFKKFFMQYGKETKLSVNGLLNTRQQLDQIGNYNKMLGQTDLSDKIAKEIRGVYDDIATKKVPELKAIDAKFAPERRFMGQLEKDYMTKDGVLKDDAITKIANLTNRGRERVLSRLEKLVPGISEDINLVRAIEDISSSNGIKVGTYLKSGVVGLAIGGGNPVIALLTALAATPEIAVPVLRSFGKANVKLVQPIERTLVKMKAGKALSEAEKKLVWAAITTFVNQKESKNESASDEYLKSLGL